MTAVLIRDVAQRRDTPSAAGRVAPPRPYKTQDQRELELRILVTVGGATLGVLALGLIAAAAAAVSRAGRRGPNPVRLHDLRAGRFSRLRRPF